VSRSNPIARLLATAFGLVLFRRRRQAGLQVPGDRERLPPDEVDAEPDQRAETLAAILLLGAALAATAFVVLYVADADTQLLGLCLGLSLLACGVASALAGKRIVIQEKSSEEYPDFGDLEEQRDVDGLLERSGTGITRRRLLFSSLAAVGAALGAAAVMPVASLGPGVGDRVYETPWAKGTAVVDENGVPITVDDLGEGEFVTGFPEGASLDDLGAPLIIVRLRPSQMQLPADRAHSAPQGIVAYSKICPHAGCAVSMFRSPLYDPAQPGPALVCPCHYSTFDPTDGGSVLFGPAGRPLPQLPLRVAADGSLEAAGGFYEPIGPSYGGIREDPRGQA
jgi:ubiquinol-cytochrome c reductase iron-sulfur subunit